MEFNKKQIMLMEKIGISINSSESISDYDVEEIEEKTSDYLQKNGFDENYNPTEEGKICEAILDIVE